MLLRGIQYSKIQNYMIVDIGSSPDLLIKQEKEGKKLVLYGHNGVNKSILKVYPFVLHYIKEIIE